MLASDTLPDPIGESTAFLDFQARLSEVAKVDRPALIIGERGTGKEMAARRLHYLSKRWDENLVTLNCAALSANLLEDELFGHEAGSFTGASRRRKGRFEAANRGTLFLDEIGQTPPELQSKILRVVEYNSFERVGSSETISVDVRIIGATNSDLPEMAKRGKFKFDLLDRLSFEVIFVPPLRARGDDIILLANHFAARMTHEMGRSGIPQFSDDVIDELVNHQWPGNVRELKNVVERAVCRSAGEMITELDFEPFRYPYGELPSMHAAVEGSVSGSSSVSPPTTPSVDSSKSWTDLLRKEIPNKGIKDLVRDMETTLMKEALRKAANNQRKAAELLDLTYHQWRGMYRKYEDEFEVIEEEA
ncbi:MAG: phage shock protein operon transcriptional activator [Opitutales bacterium]|nr:phage shock protein operon transcriptional activator [Opitutales bacterium]